MKAGRGKYLMRALGVVMAAVGLLAAQVAHPDEWDPVDQAFVAAQLALLSSAGSALQQAGLRIAAGEPALAAMVRNRQDLADRVRRLEDALTGEAGTDQRIMLRGEIDSLHHEMALIDRALVEEFPRYAELAAPEPLSIEQVQSLLNEDEALVFVLAGQAAIVVFAIGKEKVAWHRTSHGSEVLNADVAALRRQLDPHATSRGVAAMSGRAASPRVAPFDRKLAYLLYLDLLKPVEAVLSSASHLYIVGDGPLGGLPLSLLVTSEPEGADTDPDALRQTAWLVRSHSTTTLPDVAGLRVIRSLAPPAPGPMPAIFAGFGAPVLGGVRAQEAVGNPASGQSFFRGSFADVEAVRNLPNLPQTGPELRRLAASLGGRSRLYLAADATETAVKEADFSSYNIIAFATHGLLSGELSGLSEPALVLTPPEVATSEDDGLLTASEIAALELSADWVLLSACNTAGGDGRPDAEGLSGLARAFLYAGARSILVSHWPVRDDAAAMLTTRAFEILGAGEVAGRSDALQQAMLEVMMNKHDHTLAHPSAWAPFVVVGEGRR